MKRILISGYYGFNNAGDEAVLLAILQRLKEWSPAWKPVVLSADPVATARLHGVEAYDRWRWQEVLHQVRTCNAVISGGGSLFQDTTGQASLLYYLGILWLAKALGKPVFIYAQGLGPLNRRSSRLLVRATLGRVDKVILRDSESASLLTAMGFPHPVDVTADPVLALDPEQTADKAQALKALRLAGLEPDKGPIALINVRDLPGRLDCSWQQVERAVAALCAKLEEQGWQVLLLPVHWSQDLAACRRLGRNTMLTQELTLPGLLGLFSQAGLVVGMRLHALVFAALFHCPLLGLIYDPKVGAFLKQIGASGLTLEALTPENLISAVEDTLCRRDRWLRLLPDRLATLRARAAHTAHLIYECLEGTDTEGKNV